MKIFFQKFNKSNRGRQISSSLRAFQSLNGLSLSKGFTLVETLVAISIFTGSILGLMSVLSQGIANTSYAKQKMIASYLAQEGIEYIRNMRDTYVLYSSSGQTGWTAFNNNLTKSTSLCQDVKGCYFDDQKNQDDDPFSTFDSSSQPQPMTKILVASCPSGCTPLRYDSTSGKYGYNALWPNSGFTRTIKVIQVLPAPSNETKISSTVSWTQGSGNYSITFSESLFNWVQ